MKLSTVSTLFAPSLDLTYSVLVSRSVSAVDLVIGQYVFHYLIRKISVVSRSTEASYKEISSYFTSSEVSPILSNEHALTFLSFTHCFLHLQQIH